MSNTMRVLFALLGLLAGAFVFEAVSRLMSGAPQGRLWHGVMAGAAALGLWLASRSGRARTVLISACVAVLGLIAVSAQVYPALVRAWAETAAGGNPYCLLGPDVRNGDYAPEKLSYVAAAPLGRQDLSYLTSPDPLMLVVETSAGAADELPAVGDDPALQVWTLAVPARGFLGPDLPVLDLNRTSMLLDCVPAADPFAGAVGPETHPVAVIWRAVLAGADGTTRLGPRQRDVFHLPARAAPVRNSRLASAAFGVSLELRPGAAAMPVELRYWTDPSGRLLDELASHVRDGDRPIDFAGLPLDAHGLQALEYPSTSVASAVEGTYAAFASDGSPKTVIECDEFNCSHHFRPDLPGSPPLVVSVIYPLSLRPEWQEIQQAAGAKALSMLESR